MSVKVEGTNTKVVVAGAGYAGLTASVVLDGKVDLTLIERKRYHEMLTRAHLVAGGMEEVQEDIIPLNEVLKGRGTRVIHSTIRSINLNERKVSVYANSGVYDVHYDHLILALGSEVNYYDVNGAKEHALGFRSMEDALNVCRRFKDIRDGGSMLIVGGGATGISLAGALAELRSMLGKRVRITVIEALDRILYGWDEYIVDKAEDILQGKNVDILTGRKVVEVRDGSILLDDGEEIASDLTVWTAGVKGSAVELVPEVRRVKGWRIAVDEFSRIEGYDDAYALGDIAAFRLDDAYDGGGYAPQLAQFAVRQGYRVARNILSVIEGRAMKPISLKRQGAILSLGSECVGLVNGIRLEGELCRYVEEFITYNYRRMLHRDGSALLAYDDDPIASMITFSKALSYVSARYTLALLGRFYTVTAMNSQGGVERVGYPTLCTLLQMACKSSRR